MNNQFRYTAPEGELPLDNLVTDGGYASIFRTVAFVGDSLSSGEFETFDPEKNERHYYDMFEYSWGQFAARMAGFTAYNFSRGGMTASEYCDSYAAAKDWWNPALKAQAYVIALGVNDLINAGQPVGEMSDINPEDPTKNAKTFTGYYAQIIQRYKQLPITEMLSMVDTSEIINDDFLLEILDEASSSQMKNIVSTIQKAQNAIIRDTTNKILLIEGIAGSVTDGSISEEGYDRRYEHIKGRRI